MIKDPKIPVEENDYYVAFTRTKTNLFLICKNILIKVTLTLLKLKDNEKRNILYTN
jgi:hypothetical protein